MIERPPACFARSQSAFLSKYVFIGAALLVLGGCSTLPSSGPDVSEMIHASEGSSPAFRIVNLDQVDVIEAATTPEQDNPMAAISAIKPSGAVDQIHVGDSLQITVFEVGASLFSDTGGRTGASDSGEAAPAANGQVLPTVLVAPDGTITLPYAGQIEAAGRTPTEVAAAIQAALRGKSQSPQVMATVREDLGNTVILMGDVRNPGRKSLNYRRETLLDMIAISGGPTNPANDTIVRITRGGRSVETWLSEIRSASADDVALASQDHIELRYRPRTFTAFGAAGKVSEVRFDSARLSLAEALARIGGPLDQQADPTGIFIFRDAQPAGQAPTVYRLDLKNPISYFVSQRFMIKNRDVIFIANARSNSWQKFLALVSTIVSPVTTAKYLGS